MNKMKLARTPLDRRSKAAWRRDQVIKVYNQGYTQEEVAQMFGVNKMQVWRYLHYDRYLEQCRKDSARYIYRNKTSKKKKEMLDIRQKTSKAVHEEYMQYLIICKNKFKPSIVLG